MDWYIGCCSLRLAFEVMLIALAIPTLMHLHHHNKIGNSFLMYSWAGSTDAPSSSDTKGEPVLRLRLPARTKTIKATTKTARLADLDRVIAFIHVGKAGGLTVRKNSGLRCRLFQAEQTEEEFQECIERKFDPDDVLARKIKHYFHMVLRRPYELQQATSYLFVLRNPVDRIISTFRYSHPANCNNRTIMRGQPEPWGCQNLKRYRKRGTHEYRIFTKCFPSADMEVFAQSIMSPFPPDSVYDHATIPLAGQEDVSELQEQLEEEEETTASESRIAPEDVAKRGEMCRSLAHRLVRGKRMGLKMSSPHMFYNYEYYMNATVWTYPDKEVFGIRTEHEWDDLQSLDVALGGSGNFNRKRSYSHGSEHYKPSPLTAQAYQKLCCVLHDEIQRYQELLDLAVNLNDTAKNDARESIRYKCGITTSLELWQQKCHHHIDEDQQYFTFESANQKSPGRKQKTTISVL